MISGSNPVFANCVFKYNKKRGISIQECSPLFVECIITANAAHGIIIKDKDTKPQFEKCEFSNHTAGFGVAVQDNAEANFKSCKWFNNQDIHVRCFKQGKMYLEDCELYSSGEGRGINVNLSGEATILKTKIHDESSAGILIENGGQATINECEIYSCGHAITISPINKKEISKKDQSQGQSLTESVATITNNYIHDNSPYGILLRGGSATITGNKFERHTRNGLGILKEAKCVQKDNIMIGNKWGVI